jgi:hypothetical protein
MNYKGIDKAKINEIEKVKLPYKKECFELDFSKLEESGVNKMLQELVELEAKKQRHDTDMYIICEMAKKYLDTLDKSIHINDVVWDVLTDIKGVVIDEANDKDRVLIYTTEGKIYNFEKDKLIKTGEQIDVLNSVWTRKGEE